MSAFKKLNKQDVYITTHQAKKQWTLDNVTFNVVGGEIYKGVSGSGNFYIDEGSTTNGEYNRLVYNSVYHLYFSNDLGIIPPPPLPVNPITATGGVDNITLNWTVNQPDADQQLLFRQTPGSVVFIQIASLGRTVNNYVDTSVPTGTVYYYIQTQKDGLSVNSEVVSAQLLEVDSIAANNINNEDSFIPYE